MRQTFYSPFHRRGPNLVPATYRHARFHLNQTKPALVLKPTAKWFPRLTVFNLVRASALCAVIAFSSSVHAQSTASIEGQVIDQLGSILNEVEITVVSRESALKRIVATDEDGRYQISGLPVGRYRIEVKARGFQIQIIRGLAFEVARRIPRNVQLKVGV
jgi:hypothetical protein